MGNPLRVKKRRRVDGVLQNVTATVRSNNTAIGNSDDTHGLQHMEDSSGDEYVTSDVDTGTDHIDSMKDKPPSSFHRHLGNEISNEEIDDLLKFKPKYGWEIPAVDVPMSKWVGTGKQFEGFSGDTHVDVEPTLQKHWLDICGSESTNTHNPSRLRFFSLCNSYRDILHCNKKPFYHKGGEGSGVMDAYIMHALNHVYKTKKLVTKNNEKLAKKEEGAEISDVSYCDQGFTRPKVLFLLPLASIALRVVKRLVQLTPLAKTATVGHLKRFMEEFGVDDDTSEMLEDELNLKNNSQNKSKPLDFQRLFGGNNNDHFLLGVKCTKKSMNLYSDFYSSDIIIASPLGLITKFAQAESDKEKDVDYLSSIEIMIVDHADIIAMQNWDHVQTIFEKLNCMPSKQHDTDWMRVRPWYVDGHSRFYRQTILLSSYLNPDMNALFNRFCVSYEGKVKLVTEHKGVLSKISTEARQVYERFDVPSITDTDDVRFNYFCEKVYPKIKELEGVMLFISSYFEFVRLRNFLKSQKASFCILNEYTNQSDISRARLWFFEGKRKIILYTERAHFYHRYKIRGVKNLIIYSLPERKEFYPEIVNMLEGSNSVGCNVIFSNLDYLKLERIAGTGAAKRMASSDKAMFVWC